MYDRSQHYYIAARIVVYVYIVHTNCCVIILYFVANLAT